MTFRRKKIVVVLLCVAAACVSLFLAFRCMVQYAMLNGYAAPAPARDRGMLLASIGAIALPVLAFGWFACALYVGAKRGPEKWRCECCGCDLRGCADGACPECGKARGCERCGYERRGPRSVCPSCGDGE
jgi:hypothetical protein